MHQSCAEGTTDQISAVCIGGPCHGQVLFLQVGWQLVVMLNRSEAAHCRRGAAAASPLTTISYQRATATQAIVIDDVRLYKGEPYLICRD